ncbi:MAG TPA: DUF2933 domain-containing protein [Burkholderiales bacterium]|nr:DUF2933 domain-containing protein [Burkholderiales bacterium]
MKWVLWGFIAIAAFFLFTEHRAHLFGILPYLLLLACPLMHLFHGHGGHGQHGGDAGARDNGGQDKRSPGHQGHITKGN